MRTRFAALVVASALVVPAAAEAATGSEMPTGGASASQSAASMRTMKSALRKDVKRALAPVRKLDLAKVESKGFTLRRIRALVAGRASFAASGRSAPSSRRLTVTKGSRTFAKRGRAHVRLKVTKSGKKLLRSANRITLAVKATFAPRTGGRVSVTYKLTLARKSATSGSTAPEGGTQPPAVPVAPIPRASTPLYAQSFEKPGPWGGLTEQCGRQIGWGEDSGDGYAHLEIHDGDPVVADLERCEISHGGYGSAREPGEYWYQAKMRLGEGFPHDGSNPSNWTTIQQWQEDRPAPGASTGLVDSAMFVNSSAGPAGRTYLQGHFLPTSQSGVFDIHAWHDFVVHGVWTDQPNGYLEWWIDGVYVGRTTGVTSETGGRHFWKGGITRAASINTTQTADIAQITVYRAP